MNASPLANPTFRRLFSAQVIALLGTGLSTVALALLAYDLAGDNASLVLGTAFALKMVAYIGIAPLAGAYADRLPRKALLVSLDLARALMILSMILVTEVWQIYLLIFLLNACSAGFTPTFQATIPDVLPDDAQYTRALSWSRLAYDLEALLSPLLAAAALVVLSYNSLFTFNALTFVVSALLVMTAVVPMAQRSEVAGSRWQNLTRGIRTYLATPRLRGLLALSLAVSAAGAMVIVNTVLYTKGQPGGSATDTALAFAAFGGGSMLVALLLPRVLERLPDRPLMLAGGLVMTVGLSLGLSGPTGSSLLWLWAILGVGSSLVQTPSGRLLKRSTSANNRASVFAAQFALSHACWLLAYPLAGWLGGADSPANAFATLGVIALFGTIAAAQLWPKEHPAA